MKAPNGGLEAMLQQLEQAEPLLAKLQRAIDHLHSAWDACVEAGLVDDDDWQNYLDDRDNVFLHYHLAFATEPHGVAFATWAAEAKARYDAERKAAVERIYQEIVDKLPTRLTLGTLPSQVKGNMVPANEEILEAVVADVVYPNGEIWDKYVSRLVAVWKDEGVNKETIEGYMRSLNSAYQQAYQRAQAMVGDSEDEANEDDD